MLKVWVPEVEPVGLGILNNARTSKVSGSLSVTDILCCKMVGAESHSWNFKCHNTLVIRCMVRVRHLEVVKL